MSAVFDVVVRQDGTDSPRWLCESDAAANLLRDWYNQHPNNVQGQFGEARVLPRQVLTLAEVQAMVGGGQSREHTIRLTADEMAHLMIAARAQARTSGAERWLESAADKLQDVLAPLGEASPRLHPFVVDELADDGSDLDSPLFFEAADSADALRQYAAKCVMHGYKEATRTRVRRGVR